MDFQILGALVFVVLLALVLHFKKRNFTFLGRFPFAYIALYRTKQGLRLMDAFARRFSRVFKALSYPYIIIGFLLMTFFSGFLIWSFLQLFMVPEAPPSISLVLPIPIKGAFYVPFFYWIISIFFLALVHEGAHGVIARTYKMRLKSTGVAVAGLLLPLLPAAFVEPSEKEVAKRPLKQRLTLLSAGSIANMVVGLLVLLILIMSVNPLANKIMDFKGVRIAGFTEPGLAAESAGLVPGHVITSIDENKVSTLNEFEELMEQKKPGQTMAVRANDTAYAVVLGDKPGKPEEAYLGVYLEQVSELKQGMDQYKTALGVLLWFLGLLYWTYLLNIGIGLFNLLPVLPLDGGRMLKDTLEHFLEKKKAGLIVKAVNLFFIVIIAISLVASFVKS
jgi:membrane-associated protease RseP (regulator of RpoE activity)